MDKLEKVKQGLECCKHDCFTGNNCPYMDNGVGDCNEKLCADALELLKEQQPIVRCKDCRNSKVTKRIEGTYRHCPILCADVDEDFYCGFGKPKDGEQE